MVQKSEIQTRGGMVRGVRAEGFGGEVLKDIFAADPVSEELSSLRWRGFDHEAADESSSREEKIEPALNLRQRISPSMLSPFSNPPPPNQALEPTTTAVTIRAAARLAPAAVVAHL